MEIIFQICCEIVRVLSGVFCVTYEEMNTILFIYVQPILILISFAIVVSVILAKLFKHISILKLFLIALFGMGGFIYSLTTFAVWNQYSALSLHDTCVLAYDDLKAPGGMTGMGYVGINLFLFIIFVSSSIWL